MTDAACPRCAKTGAALAFQGRKFRVIRAEQAGVVDEAIKTGLQALGQPL
jgi:hypothetical protein